MQFHFCPLSVIVSLKRNPSFSPQFVFTLHADLMPDSISAPLIGATDLVFLRLIQRRPALTTRKAAYAVIRLSNRLVYLGGRSVRLYVNKPNPLLVTEVQTGRV